MISSKRMASFTASVGSSRTEGLPHVICVCTSCLLEACADCADGSAALEDKVRCGSGSRESGCGDAEPPPRSGVMDPGAGEMTTRGPVHLERLATTSANRRRSAKAALGCALICCHASLQGIVSTLVEAGCGTGAVIFFAPQLLAEERLGQELQASRQQLPDPGPIVLFPNLGQFAQGSDDTAIIDWPTAMQNALPNASSAQAKQLDGSPEHVGPRPSSAGAARTAKIALLLLELGRRRRGTGA
jgi:hypothetical protein